MSKPLTKLTLASIAKMDGGRLGIAFQDHIERARQDCMDRPGESKPRVVTMTVTIKPKLDVDGLCETVDTQVKFADTIPKRQSKIYNMSLTKQGIGFNDESLENVEQKSLEFDGENEQ